MKKKEKVWPETSEHSWDWRCHRLEIRENNIVHVRGKGEQRTGEYKAGAESGSNAKLGEASALGGYCLVWDGRFVNMAGGLCLW